MSCTYDKTLRTGTVRVTKRGRDIEVRFPNRTTRVVKTARQADRAACDYLGRCCAHGMVGIGDVVWTGVEPPS